MLTAPLRAYRVSGFCTAHSQPVPTAQLNPAQRRTTWRHPVEYTYAVTASFHQELPERTRRKGAASASPLSTLRGFGTSPLIQSAGGAASDAAEQGLHDADAGRPEPAVASQSWQTYSSSTMSRA